MAALDLPAEAAAALVTAWELADSALTEATLKFTPTHDYNPSTGANVVTWGTTVSGKKILVWDEAISKQEGGDRRNEGQAARHTKTKALVRAVDITPAVPGLDSVIVIDSVDWKVEEVQKPPTGTFYILTIRK